MMSPLNKFLVGVIGTALFLTVLGRALSEKISQYALMVFLVLSFLLVLVNLINRRKITTEYVTHKNPIGALVLSNHDVLVVTDANDPSQIVRINGIHGTWIVTATLRDYGDDQELEAITLKRLPQGPVRAAHELFFDGLFESGVLFIGDSRLLDESIWPKLREEIAQTSNYAGDGMFGLAIPHGAGNAQIHVGRSRQGEIVVVLIKVLHE